MTKLFCFAIRMILGYDNTCFCCSNVCESKDVTAGVVEDCFLALKDLPFAAD
jgi:hypothetical protein